MTTVINPVQLTIGGVSAPDILIAPGSNKLLLYGISMSASTALVTSVTYGGAPMTLLTKIEDHQNAKAYIFYMLNDVLDARSGNSFVVTSSPTTGSGIPNHATIVYADAEQALSVFAEGRYVNADPQPYEVTITGIAGALGFCTVLEQGSAASFAWGNAWVDEGQGNNNNSSFGVASKSLAAGSETVSITITNGELRKAIVAVRVDNFTGAVNNPPTVVTPIPDQVVTVGVAFSLDVSANFTDPDGDTLSYLQSNLPNGLSISFDGIISGVPTGGFS